jgi:hypothetical protein
MVVKLNLKKQKYLWEAKFQLMNLYQQVKKHQLLKEEKKPHQLKNQLKLNQQFQHNEYI